MNSHDALHHGKRAANKGGRSVWQICNRTKLTMLVTVDMFELQRVICQKSPILNYSTCIWQLLWGWRRWSFAEIFSMRTQSPWVIVWHCLHDPTFSHFSRTRLVTDRQTDKRRQDIPLPCMVQKVNSLATVFTAHFHISQLHTAALIFYAHNHQPSIYHMWNLMRVWFSNRLFAQFSNQVLITTYCILILVTAFAVGRVNFHFVFELKCLAHVISNDWQDAVDFKGDIQWFFGCQSKSLVACFNIIQRIWILRNSQR